MFFVIKKIFAAAAVFLLVLSLCCCNTATLSADDVATSLLECGAFSESKNLIPLDNKQLEEHFGFKSELLDGFSVYVNSLEGTASEFGVFEIHEEDDLNTVIDAIKRYSSPATLTSSNSTANNFLLMRRDKLIIYVLSPAADQAEEALLELGAEEIN